MGFLDFLEEKKNSSDESEDVLKEIIKSDVDFRKTFEFSGFFS